MLYELARVHRGRLVIAYLLTSSGMVAGLLYPLATGLAINGVLSGEYLAVLWLVGCHAAQLVLTVASKRYDSRVFTRIYAVLASTVVRQSRADGLDPARVAARASLSREYTDFLEEDVSRIRPANMRSAGCVSLWHAMSRVEDTDPARANRQDLSGVANLYSANPAPGPFHHCMAGAVFSVGSGETLHRPWRSLGKSGPAFLELPDARIAIEERGGTLSRYNDQNVEEHPMALVQDSRAYFFPGIGVKPLDGDDLVREEATWRFDLGARNHSVALSVSFPAAEASAGMAFLERLEFAAPNDPRCDGRGAG